MRSPLPIAVCLVLLLDTLTYANSYKVSESPTDTLKITAQIITSGIPEIKASFIVKDSMHTRVLRSRMQEIKTMIPELNSTVIVNEPSALGYKGLGVTSTNLLDLILFNTYKGQMYVAASIIASSFDYLNDFNSEMEYLIAKTGIKENLITNVNGNDIIFSSLIPDELKRTDTKYGILTLEMTTDTFNVDFSLLLDKINYIPARVKQPIFKDIQITRAHEISSSQYAYWISSIEGIAPLQQNVVSMESSFTYTTSSIDSMLKLSIPKLDSLSNSQDTMHFEQKALFSQDVHKYSYLIKTTDLGIVYLKPISYFIGGIDRISFFWVYSSDSVFDSVALKKFDNQTVTQRSVTRPLANGNASHTRLTNLSGRLVETRSANLNASRKPGLYLKDGSKGIKPIINFK
jgi:hypothetical protein